MPTKDQIFEEICTLVEQGAAPMGCGPEVRDVLRARYYDWIDSRKPNMDRSPMDVWEGPEGSGLKGRFRAIGRAAAQRSQVDKKDRVDQETSTTAYMTVESESDCPLCPPPRGG